MVRYGLGSNSYILYGDEGTPYSLAATRTKQFGLISEDVSPPRPNKKTPLPGSGSRRAPHVWAQDVNEYAFDVPFHVQHADAPFHAALGAKAVTSQDPDTVPASGDEYTRTLFTETSILPTISVEYGAKDLDVLQQFIGTKASLGLTCRKGESLKGNMGLVCASEAHDTTTPTFQTPVIPTNEPFRFSHIQHCKLFQPGTQTLIKNVASLDGFDFKWNPGLEAVPHGGSGRENYSVVEGNPEGLYDMKISVTAQDADLFTRAADNSGLFDLEIALARTIGTGGVLTDAFIARLYNCTVLDAPLSMPASGRVTTEIPLGPLSTDLEIRTPA